MNDRFRFRAWQKDYQKMYYDAEMTYDYPCEPRGVEQSSFGDVLENDDYVVMQCTGLKDKNGKLIYEGDIIKCGNNGQFIYKIGFNKRFASFALIRKEDAFYHYFGEAVEAEDVEVIGNIHENLELVK